MIYLPCASQFKIPNVSISTSGTSKKIKRRTILGKIFFSTWVNRFLYQVQYKYSTSKERDDLTGTSGLLGPNTIKLKMYNLHILYSKSVLVQLVKARVYYVQQLCNFNLKITKPNPSTKTTTISTRIMCSQYQFLLRNLVELSSS